MHDNPGTRNGTPTPASDNRRRPAMSNAARALPSALVEAEDRAKEEQPRALEWWRPVDGDGREGLCFRTSALTIALVAEGRRNAPVVPVIRLQGRWLKELGWSGGDLVIVDADRECIRIYRSDGNEDTPGVAEG